MCITTAPATPWCIYPMYDYTHCISDALEGVTHSLCSLEFENNRPLYDWVLDNIPAPCHPSADRVRPPEPGLYVLSKRKLTQLVPAAHVAGWPAPRMPTRGGGRRRGYTPEALRDFCDRIGISKADNLVDMALLEHCLREDLNRRARRVMGVLKPVKLVIENYPENAVETIDFPYHPENPAMGSRPVPFSRELFVERDDFCEEAPKKWYRLAPGAEVRLRHAYYVTCTGFDKDPQTGEIAAIRCVHDPATKGGWSTDGRKVRGTLHWVSAATPSPPRSGSTTACSPRSRRPRGRRTSRPTSIPTPWRSCPRPCSNPAWPRPKPARSSSSNVWATFAWTAIPPPPRPSSTAPWPSRTPGPRSPENKPGLPPRTPPGGNHSPRAP